MRGRTKEKRATVWIDRLKEKRWWKCLEGRVRNEKKERKGDCLFRGKEEAQG